MPCGHGSFPFYVVWAACAAGGRWGPVRGCRPSEAPSALPPDDPAGPSIFHQSPRFPTAPATGRFHWLSNSHQSARAARLLLRELPSLRSGDLPARRAIPSPAFALHKSCGDVYLFEGLFAVLYSFAVEGFLLLIFACWCLLVQAANAPAAFVRGLLAFEGLLRV